MHEQSETIQRNGKWINVYGRHLPKAGQQLPDTLEYDTLAEAEQVAQVRSDAYVEPKLLLKKYQGDPDRPDLEADHIQNNRLRAMIRDARHTATIKSGAADRGIQSPIGKTTKPSIPSQGKYFARPIKESMAYDPSLLEAFPNLIRNMSIQEHVKSKNTPDVFSDMTLKNLSTGAFADAYKRQGRQYSPVLVAGLPIGAGGEGNKSATSQLQELAEQEKAGITGPVKTAPKGMVHTDALRSHEEIMKRIPPPRKKAAEEPEQPMESEESIRKRLGM